MAINPIPPLLVATLGLIFITSIFGNSLADESFSQMTNPPGADQCSPGFLGLGSFFCGFAYAVSGIINFFKIIFGGIAFFINAISFNIPGAPWYARVPIGITLGGSIFVSVLGFIRGN